jgi:prolyl-tRNA synthetase
VSVPAPAPVDASSAPAAVVCDTPDSPTIASLVDLLNSRPDLARGDRAWTAADTLKNVIVMLRHPDGRREPLAIGVPGDREVDMKRLEANVGPAEPEAFTDEDFARHPHLVKGYIGPATLGAAHGIRYLVDPRVVNGTRWVTGANETGRHVVGLVTGRDFIPDGTIEAAEVREGDTCPSCAGTLEMARGIEIGHIFQLGRKYAQALDLTVLDQNGKQVVVTMGSYGIGVSRAVAAIAESSCDELGLCWPREVAPADVHLVIAGKGGDEISATAERIAAELDAASIRVLLDDRTSVSPGVKFKDAELLGVPTIVIVGKGLADGVIEVRDRKSGERRDVRVDDVVSELITVVRG